MNNGAFDPFALHFSQSTRLPTESCTGSLPREGDLFFAHRLAGERSAKNPKTFVEGLTDTECYTAKWLKSSSRDGPKSPQACPWPMASLVNSLAAFVLGRQPHVKVDLRAPSLRTGEANQDTSRCADDSRGDSLHHPRWRQYLLCPFAQRFLKGILGVLDMDIGCATW
jgi:hypothetical protein